MRPMFWENKIYEVKIDIDLNKQDPCWVGVRLQKIYTFLSNICWYVGIYKTANGFHIRGYLREPINRDTDLVLRAVLNDDRERWRLDLWRTTSGQRQFDILFTYRVKKYDREHKVGSEVPITLEDALKIVEELCMERKKK